MPVGLACLQYTNDQDIKQTIANVSVVQQPLKPTAMNIMVFKRFFDLSTF